MAFPTIHQYTVLQKKQKNQSKSKYPENYFSDTEAVVNKRKKRTRSLEKKKRKSVIHSDHNASSSDDDVGEKSLENVKLEIVEINNNDKQTSFPPSKDSICLQPQQRTSLIITEPDEITKGDRRLSVVSNCSSVSSSAASAISSSISRPSIIILNHHHHHHSESGATAAAPASATGSNSNIINASSSLASNWNHNHNNLRRSVSCNSPASSIVTIDEILNGYNAHIIDDYGTVELRRKSSVSIM